MTERKTIESVLPPGELATRVSYDPLTGILIFKPKDGCDRLTKTWNSRFAGKVAGSKVHGGYLELNLSVASTTYRLRAHRIAWALMTGEWLSREYDIDHINGDPSDNSWVNLRRCLHHQNMRNQSRSVANTTGYKGVAERRDMKSGAIWQARITVGGKTQCLGHFDTAEDAARAYDLTALKLHGEFARTNASLGLL